MLPVRHPGEQRIIFPVHNNRTQKAIIPNQRRKNTGNDFRLMFLQDIFYIRRRSLVGNIMIHVVPLSEIQFYIWRYFASIIAIDHPVGNSIYGKYPTGLATECRKSIIPTRRNYIFGRGLGKQSSTFCISIIKQHIVLSRER